MRKVFRKAIHRSGAQVANYGCIFEAIRFPKVTIRDLNIPLDVHGCEKTASLGAVPSRAAV